MKFHKLLDRADEMCFAGGDGKSDKTSKIIKRCSFVHVFVRCIRDHHHYLS